MRKNRILYVSLIFLILQVFIFIGLAVWVIPHQENVTTNENLNGLWEKYLGGQSIVYNDSRVVPTSTNLSLVNPSGYTVSHRLISDTKYSPGGPIDPGSYIIRYTNGTETYDVTFTILPKESINNVAFIPGTLGDSSTYAYYTTIEAALYVASSGQSVYVIPGTNPIITSDCEVKSGVKLCLPYEMPDGTGINSTNGEDKTKLCTILHVTGQTTSFYPAHTDATLLTNEVKVSDNVKLMNNGDIYIGGNLNGGYCWNYSGLVGNYGYTDIDGTPDSNSNTGKDGVSNGTAFKGYYAQITLGYNSRIESTGYIECNGYIVGNHTELASGEIIHNSEVRVKSGEIRLPFITPENRQGSRFAILAGGILKYSTDALFSDNINLSFDATPFNRFYFQNCATKLRVDHGGSLTGYINLYANNQNNSNKATFVGSNTSSTIQLKEGSYFIGSTTLNTDKNKDYGANQLQLDLYGGAYLNDLTMIITAKISALGTKNCHVSTKGLFFPVSWYYDVRLHNNYENNQTDASYKFNSMVKIMPGASLLVDEGVTLECNNLVIYDEAYDEESLGMDPFDMGAKDHYPNDKGPGVLTVNGTIVADSTGGLYNTENTNAIAQIKSSASITSKEWTEIDSGGSWSATSSTAKTTSFGYNLQMYLYSDKKLHTSGLNKGTYYSKHGYWDTSSSINYYTLTYNSNGVGSNPSSKVIPSPTIKYKLTSEDLPILSAYHYDFLGWYDSNNNLVKVGDEIISSTTLTAKWEAITYNINYVIDADVGITKPNVSNINPTTFNVDTLPTLVDLIDSNYVINGWFLDSDYSGTEVFSLSLDNLEYLNDNVITLYTKWMEPIPSKFNITMIVKDESNQVLYSYTVENFESEGKGIAYFNPYTTDYGLPYSKDNNNDSSVMQYFDGWYYDSTYQTSCGNENIIQFTDSDDNVETIDNYTIYAKVITKHTIRFNLVILGVTKKEEYYYNSYTLSDVTIGDGYRIDGWFVNSDTSSKELNTSLTNLENGGVTTLKADISVRIKYNSDGGDTVGDRHVKYNGTLSSADLPSITKAKSGNTTYTFDAWYTNLNKTTKATTSTVVSAPMTLYAKFNEDSECIVSGTYITLADGSKKLIDEITFDDLILVFNHETGKLDVSKMLFITHNNQDTANYEILELRFNNGNILKIVQEHVLFDVTLNKYVEINKYNVNEYIGHIFYTNEFVDGYYKEKYIILDSYDIYNDNVKIYCPVTAFHMNCFANDILIMPSMPNSVNGLFNIFELDEDMKYNVEQKEADIAKYGIFTYEEFNEYIGYEITYEAYLASPAIYLKVSVGKGLITQEEIIMIIEYLLSGSLIT